MNTQELLKSLSEAFGPPGLEDAVRNLVVDELRGHVDEMRVDALGNLLALKRGTGRHAGGVMLSAHMDEVALMVMGVDSDGTLRFRNAGGIDDRVLLGKALRVGPERIPGVIGLKPIHLLRGNERGSVVKIDAMRIDIGAENKDAAARRVKPGDYAVFATQYGPLGAGEHAPSRLVKGKAFDDRAGCAVLVELLRGESFAFDVHGVFSVQEEIGSRGARVAAYGIDPLAAIALEATTADDLPKEFEASPSTVLGNGPAITVMDRSMVADARMVEHVLAAARALQMDVQFKQPGTGGTDAGAIHLSRAGVPSTVISVPCRYIHSPVAVLNLNDFENTIKLARAALDRFSPDVLARA